ncbi:phage virion morphogenesis protein [Neptuniibacter sp.]|uniref:phage virion morphogenesis protein n=1 Tax=Neptuniibacter sp. TaxID=1962643 RepID=UPI003B5B6872
MAGVKIEYNDTGARRKVQGILGYLKHPAPLFAILNEYLLQIHRKRFREQISPDGTPWAPLSPRYQKRKHRNKNKILTLRGHLQGTLRGQYDDEGLEFGTNSVYGAIHNFGGSIKKKQRTSLLYFYQRKDGSVGNRFKKKNRSNFAQETSIKEHDVYIPARPWLGTSTQNDQTILDKTIKYLQRAVRA